MKTWTPLIRSVIVAFLFSIFVIGCSQKRNVEPSAQSAPEIKTEATIDPGVSVGGVHQGMSIQQVLEKLGEPDHRTEYILDYKKLGFSVVMSKSGQLGAVFCGDSSGTPDSPLVKAFKGRTKEGIGMGASRADIIKTYGETMDKIPLPPGQQALPGRDSLVYKNLGLTFSLIDDHVCHIIVRFK